MPRKRNSQAPPVMTWGRAVPVLAISVVFDALRLMFEFFWFFGPALAAIYCAATTTTKVGDFLCSATAVAAGVVGAAPIAALGVIMAMAVGFAGWLTVGFILFATNSRIFKEQGLWFVGSLLLSEVPILGAIPAITVSVWKMYNTQIKVERAALQKFEKENASSLNRERQQEAARVAQAQSAQQMRIVQQEAANDAVYGQIEAANDEKYNNEEIPEGQQKAA